MFRIRRSIRKIHRKGFGMLHLQKVNTTKPSQVSFWLRLSSRLRQPSNLCMSPVSMAALRGNYWKKANARKHDWSFSCHLAHVPAMSWRSHKTNQESPLNTHISGYHRYGVPAVNGEDIRSDKKLKSENHICSEHFKKHVNHFLRTFVGNKGLYRGLCWKTRGGCEFTKITRPQAECSRWKFTFTNGLPNKAWDGVLFLFWWMIVTCHKNVVSPSISKYIHPGWCEIFRCWDTEAKNYRIWVGF